LEVLKWCVLLGTVGGSMVWVQLGGGAEASGELEKGLIEGGGVDDEEALGLGVFFAARVSIAFRCSARFDGFCSRYSSSVGRFFPVLVFGTFAFAFASSPGMIGFPVR